MEMEHTPEESYSLFVNHLDAVAYSKEVREFILSVHSKEWFVRNTGVDFPFEPLAAEIYSPRLLPKNLSNDALFLIERYLGSIESASRSIGFRKMENMGYRNRLADPNLSFEALAEIRILDIVSRSGFNLVVEHETTGGQNVEAKISFGEWESLLECKVLNMSEESRKFHNNLDNYNAMNVHNHLEHQYTPCGEIEFLTQSVKEEEWDALFQMTTMACKDQEGYKFSTENLRATIAPYPNEDFEALTTIERFPYNCRIKSTLDKANKKVRNQETACILFCIVPIESGMQGACDSLKELLKSKKYRKISQVVVVNPNTPLKASLLR